MESQNTLYAYLIGSSFDDIAEPVANRIEEFIRSRTWLCPRVWSVDRTLIAADGDPEWNLGVCLDLPDPKVEPPGWFADVAALVGFLVQLRIEFQHDIILGLTDNRTGCAEDILEIDSDSPDLAYLRRVIGTQPPA